MITHFGAEGVYNIAKAGNPTIRAPKALLSKHSFVRVAGVSKDMDKHNQPHNRA